MKEVLNSSEKWVVTKATLRTSQKTPFFGSMKYSKDYVNHNLSNVKEWEKMESEE
jgi:hypothetical protein